MLWICEDLRHFVSHKVNHLERYIHGQLSRVAPVECIRTFFLVYILYTRHDILVRRVIHLQSLFHHWNKIILFFIGQNARNYESHLAGCNSQEKEMYSVSSITRIMV